jgi:hypothetical protein
VLRRDNRLVVLTGRLELSVMHAVMTTVDRARGKTRLRRPVVADSPGV